MLQRLRALVVLLAVVGMAWAHPQGGFRPLYGARQPRDADLGPTYTAPGNQQLGSPDKTIYVRLPAEEQQQLPPISAGPPQKHYRIVIVKSPTPPAVQPVLPPRSEQKTIIYVLHQKPKLQQQVIESPVVKHPPQVLFVNYDKELSTEDLQKLAKGDHSGFTVTSQQDAHAAIDAAAGQLATGYSN